MQAAEALQRALATRAQLAEDEALTLLERVREFERVYDTRLGVLDQVKHETCACASIMVGDGVQRSDYGGHCW